MKNKVIAFITSKTTFKQTQKEKKTLSLSLTRMCAKQKTA